MDEAQDPHNTRDMGHCSMSDHQQKTVEIEQGEVVMVIGSPSLPALASPFFAIQDHRDQAASTSRADLRLAPPPGAKRSLCRSRARGAWKRGETGVCPSLVSPEKFPDLPDCPSDPTRAVCCCRCVLPRHRRKREGYAGYFWYKANMCCLTDVATAARPPIGPHPTILQASEGSGPPV